MKRILSKKNGMLKLIVLMMVLSMTMMSLAACGGGSGTPGSNQNANASNNSNNSEKDYARAREAPSEQFPERPSDDYHAQRLARAKERMRKEQGDFYGYV